MWSSIVVLILHDLRKPSSFKTQNSLIEKTYGYSFIHFDYSYRLLPEIEVLKEQLRPLFLDF